MNIPKVSIIIPVYNTESYVGEAIESIRNQTLQSFEIITINDGSTDRSLAILNSFAEIDRRIKVYSQPNLGVSAARNKGLEYVTGEFIYFLDSDDVLESHALEECYQICTEENLDFVFFDAEKKYTKAHQAVQDYTHENHSTQNIWNGLDLLNYQIDHCIYRSPIWLNFIRTHFLQQQNLKFYPGIIHEDELFTFLLYINASRIDYLPKTLAIRRLRENSIMTQKFSWKNIKGYLTVTNELIKYRKNKSVRIKQTIDKQLNAMLNAMFWNAHRLLFKEKIKLLYLCIKNNYIKYINSRNIIVLFFKTS